MKSIFLFRPAVFRAALLCAVLSACGGGGDAPAALPVDPPTPPVVEPPAAFAYLLYQNKAEVCEVDSAGLLSSCARTGELSGYEVLSSMAVGGSHVYIANVGLAGTPSAIIHCSIAENGALSGCAETGPADLGRPEGLTLHGSTLYIGHSGTARVRKCEIDSGGALKDCVSAGFPDTLANSAGDVQIVGTTAYVLHRNQSKLSKCTVAVADGSFSDCADAGVGGLANPSGLTISGNHMYITNPGSSNVVRCIVEAGGSPEHCEDAGAAGLWEPQQIAVRGSSVYIADQDGNVGLVRCTADSNGLLSGCASMFGEPKSLRSIAFK